MLLAEAIPWQTKLHILDHQFVHHASIISASNWQSVDISERAEMQPHELLNVTIEHAIPETMVYAMTEIKPNLPWAEDHFEERVSGKPLNPPPSHEWWPFNRRSSNDQFRSDERFSHTYPERFWPKRAGNPQFSEAGSLTRQVDRAGIRFAYGDLMDVVSHLVKDPLSRQAYLPVWFPEDTGIVHGQRVPCTLGYHFIIRDNKLHCVYYIRSCDYMRHFADDVYMAMRLTQWVLDKTEHDHLDMGVLTMHITSFHVFAGDIPLLRSRLGKAK